ncbi:MAG: glycosyltransferase family 61 protein [Opitutales bacterium]|jgi:capsular polysaccharide biosynthesis protein
MEASLPGRAWKRGVRGLARTVAAGLRGLPGSSLGFGPPRRFYATLEEWAASEAGPGGGANQLISLRLARMEERPLPTVADAPIRQLFERMVPGQVKPQAVAVLERGRYWGRGFGYIVTAQDALVCRLSPEFAGFGALDNPAAAHDGLQAWRLPKVRRFRGRLLALNTLFCSNFHHWLLDTLPKFELLRRAGLGWGDCDGVIFDYRDSRWQNEALEALGIPREKIVRSDASVHLQADELVVPTYSEPGGCPEKYSYSPEGTGFVRELFLPATGPGERRRILLSRRLAGVRRLHNEEAVLAALTPLGFEAHCLENYSVREQAALFGGADAVVMPHGGGLANCVFLPRGATVVELFDPSYLPTFMMPLAARMGLNYAALVGTEAPAEAGKADMVVEPGRILEALSALALKG